MAASLMSDQPELRPMTTWQHYRRTLPITQVFILTLVVATYIVARPPWYVLLALLISLEIFSYLGAMWGAMLARRIAAKGLEEPPTTSKKKRK